MARLKEECGVVAVYQMGRGNNSNVTPLVVRGLLELQNRGQLSAGLTSYNPDRNRILQTHKDLGSVSEVFRLHSRHKSQRLMEEYGGIAAIGHNRYATSGSDDGANAQPFERVHGRMWKWFAIAFNGNLANYGDLKAELESAGYHITYHSDTEVMMHCINREMRSDEQPEFATMFANLAKAFDGAYNIAFINAAGELVVMRDPLGIKPMCYAVQDDLLVVASESVVQLNMGIQDVHMLEPGEMIVATRDGYRVERFAPVERRSYCFFEWVYFSNLASTQEGRSVYRVRNQIGHELAEMELETYSGQDGAEAELPGEMVISVPETANTVANAFGFGLGLPVEDGLLRNRYVGRTFIEGVNRQEAVRRKFTPLTDILEGRRIYLVDDTLVRGTTLRTVIAILKERGRAKEVHVRIGCPPVMGPCFYGIDLSSVHELFAPAFFEGKGSRASNGAGNGAKNGGPREGMITDGRRDPNPEQLARMAKDLGADSLAYLSMGRLVKAVGLPRDDLCMACLDSNYPTPAGERRYRASLEAPPGPRAIDA